jgi:very-short-patch-repair endonuclease
METSIERLNENNICIVTNCNISAVFGKRGEKANYCENHKNDDMFNIKTFAWHPKSLYWSNKNLKIPQELPLYYYKKFWFKCDRCPHEFETNLNSVSRIGSWCSYCSNKILCKDDSCIICFDKSFASEPKSIYWSEKNTETPRELFKYSNKTYFFRCLEHREFNISLNSISRGRWCINCGYKSMKEKQRLSHDEFSIRCKEKYDETFDYTKVILDGVDRPIIIKCKIHSNEFKITPYNHLNSKNGGCDFCVKDDSIQTNLKSFLNMANEKYKYKYDYSLVNSEFISMGIEVTIKCPLHSFFEQKPCLHLLSEYGCPRCARESSSKTQALTTERFIEKSKLVHGDRYDYSKSCYISGHKNITIICKKHGSFDQDPYNHINGYGCKRCTQIYCLEDFIEEAKLIHNNTYDYSESIYIKSQIPIKIFCKRCKKLFDQTPNSHLRGAGCIICINKTEKKLFEYLNSNFENVINQFNAEWSKNENTGRKYRYDFMIPQFKIIIELDGRQHFQQIRNWINPEEQIKTDCLKMMKAIQNGYKIIRIFQPDVYNYDINFLNDYLKPHINNHSKEIIYISSEIEIYKHHKLTMLCDNLDKELEDLEDFVFSKNK